MYFSLYIALSEKSSIILCFWFYDFDFPSYILFYFFSLYCLTYTTVKHFLDNIKSLASEHILDDDTDKHRLALILSHLYEFVLFDIQKAHIVRLDVCFSGWFVSFSLELLIT